MLKCLSTKARPFVVLVFALAALGIFVLSTAFGTAVCSRWYGLIVGGVLMLTAIPCHLIGKKHPLGHLLSYLLTAVGNGFSASAYYLSRPLRLGFPEMLLACIPAAGILFLVYLMLQVYVKSKRVTLTVAFLLDIALMAIAIVLWITDGTLIFSFAFFAALIASFYLAVFGITVGHEERSVLRDVSFGGFGSFIILTVVVIFIITEGDVLDGADLDFSHSKKKKKGKGAK